MREILFRGKREDNGRWIQGDYQHFHIENDIYVYIGRWGEEMRSVKPETVGQFTGLTDKNGTKIFEGDIVRYVNPDEDVITGSVVYGEHAYVGTHEIGFYVAWKIPEFAMYLRNDLGFWTKCREIEVIGNIHDNPEFVQMPLEDEYDG